MTKAGKDMTTCSVAVDVAGRDAEQETLWVSNGFPSWHSAPPLRAEKGQMVSAIVGYKRRDDTVIWRMEGESAEELRHRIATTLTAVEIFFEVSGRDGITDH